MKKKMYLFYIILFMIIANGLTCMSTNNTGSPITQNNIANGSEYTTIITDGVLERIIEMDSEGDIIWELSDLSGPSDAERLSNGNTVICNHLFQQVFEANLAGGNVWEKKKLQTPFDAERLPNGNTLIANYNGGTVIEVDSDGIIVDILMEDISAAYADVERLDNGNTLIVCDTRDYIYELNPNNEIIWELFVDHNPTDVERLSNGNTLITNHGEEKVTEVNSLGETIWEIDGLIKPWDSERLENGNTLIADLSRVIEVDPDGDIVWEATGFEWAVDVERIYKTTNYKPGIDFENPEKGYYHLSGIPIMPNIFGVFTDTLTIGGFRLKPVLIKTVDDTDISEDLTVKIYINGDEKVTAGYNHNLDYHEWYWTGFALGIYELTVTAEDSLGETGTFETDIFNFCFIP